MFFHGAGSNLERKLSLARFGHSNILRSNPGYSKTIGSNTRPSPWSSHQCTKWMPFWWTQFHHNEMSADCVHGHKTILNPSLSLFLSRLWLFFWKKQIGSWPFYLKLTPLGVTLPKFCAGESYIYSCPICSWPLKVWVDMLLDVGFNMLELKLESVGIYPGAKD